MLIAQISDTHIVAPGQKTLGVAAMDKNLTRVVDHINRLVPRPDIVLLTGDVTDDGDISSVRNAAAILARLDPPLLVIPGNHDDRDTLWSMFGAAACPSRVGDFLCHASDLAGLRLIGLDSTIPNASGGALCDTRLDWLEARLRERPDLPVLLYLHHPPLRIGVLETDEHPFIGATRFGDIVARHPRIERILCGHVHLNTHSRWHGTIVSTAPGIGMQLGLDLTMRRPSEFYLSEPGYLLHHLTAIGALITHSMTVAGLDGPFLFEPVPATEPDP